jgi:hypothetical protein
MSGFPEIIYYKKKEYSNFNPNKNHFCIKDSENAIIYFLNVLKCE